MAVGPGSPYVVDYRGAFAFPLSPQALWDEVERFERFERWWAWLGDFVVEGEGLRAGTVLRGTVAPPLPYRMRVAVRLVDCEAPRRIEARVLGDLEGPARLTLAPATGGGTRVDVAWSVEMRQPVMRLAARVAHPLLRWGHDRVVEATAAGFRRHLAATAPAPAR